MFDMAQTGKSKLRIEQDHGNQRTRKVVTRRLERGSRCPVRVMEVHSKLSMH
jgi:hypothetical protein